MDAMAKKSKPLASGKPERKQRTREHIIAEMSVNHVERLALACGYTVQRPAPDYGFDLRLETFQENGEVEEEYVPLQLKATDVIERYELAAEDYFSFPVSVKDYHLWTATLMPVFLILYDAHTQEAYWLSIPENETANKPQAQGQTMHLHIPRSHVLGVQTIRRMRKRKNDEVEKIRNAIK
jgi:hypothetical protein